MAGSVRRNAARDLVQCVAMLHVTRSGSAGLANAARNPGQVVTVQILYRGLQFGPRGDRFRVAFSAWSLFGSIVAAARVAVSTAGTRPRHGAGPVR